MRIRTNLTAGRGDGGNLPNHNQPAVRATAAGDNHNQTAVRAPRVKSTIKAGRSVDPGGGGEFNHNQTAVRSSEGLRVRSNVKAGGIIGNHSQTAVRAVHVRSSVKAGGLGANHNQTTVRSSEGLRVRSKVKAGASSLGSSMGI
jgi:hypothetical protein